ncbi:MAG: beta-galactosidase [Bacteroidales bacterium]
MTSGKIFTLLFVMVISAGTGLQAQGQPEPVKPGFFPFSVWYSGGKARAPMLSEITEHSEEEWRHDLKQIKALGFNTVRTWVEWAACEPVRGEYNFENLHMLMNMAREAGLRVIIQMYADSAPDWVAEAFPHALFETQSGIKVYPQSAPGACTDNAEVREAVLSFYTETAKVASTYPNFFGWDLWSEPHIINWAHLDYVPNVQFCFCPGTTSRFRNWLADKYGSIDTLNHAWHRTFTSWDQVEPPRFSTILSYTDFIDWKTFIYEKLVDDMRYRYEAIRKADTTNLITAHAVGASLFQSPYSGSGATDDFMMSAPLDFYGVSIYPKHNHPDRHWSVTTLRTVMDFTRSANREKGGWYVGELQAGMGTIALLVSDPVVPDDHRIWVWSAIAKGAKGINIYAYYPMSSGYEAGGYGLINLDGTITKRAVHAGEIADIVNRNQELFLCSTPVKAEIGIVYNPLSQMVGGMQRRDYPGAHTNSLIGYFRAFADQNVPVDFIHREHLEKQELSQYKLVIVPWPVMITKDAAEGIRAFVENGGHVLAEARIGWNDERGYASEIIPGLGLHEVFGVREHEVRMSDEVNIMITDSSHPAISNFNPGDMFRGSLYAKSVTPLENREVDILARLENGNPAIVSSKYGNGEAILAGSYLGMANHPDPVPENEEFFMNLLNWARVDRPFISSHDGNKENYVEVRLQENEGGFVLYLINHSNSIEKITVELKTPHNASHRIRDVIMDIERRIRAKNNILTLETTLDAKQVKVLDISF